MSNTARKPNKYQLTHDTTGVIVNIKAMHFGYSKMEKILEFYSDENGSIVISTFSSYSWRVEIIENNIDYSNRDLLK